MEYPSSPSLSSLSLNRWILTRSLSSISLRYLLPSPIFFYFTQTNNDLRITSELREWASPYRERHEQLHKSLPFQSGKRCKHCSLNIDRVEEVGEGKKERESIVIPFTLTILTGRGSKKKVLQKKKRPK